MRETSRVIQHDTHTHSERQTHTHSQRQTHTHTHTHTHANTETHKHTQRDTFMHLADAFVQSDLQCIQAIHFFFCEYMCSLGIEPTTFVLLTQCSTTEPQEHMYSCTHTCTHTHRDTQRHTHRETHKHTCRERHTHITETVGLTHICKKLQ